MKLTKTIVDDLTYEINGAAIEVHKDLGPGLLEGVYHMCLMHELANRGLTFKSELKVPIIFKGESINADLRCDLFVENLIVVELKSNSKLAPIHDAQLLTYMRLLNSPKGILYNFNVVNLYSQGQKTMVNQFYKDLDD